MRVVTDQNAQVVSRHDFLPFGEEWNPPANAKEKKLFTGHERDAETGLDYFGARYYRPQVGRFTTIDPLQTTSENLADPQRWNRYAYVRNNPLRWVDPDGRQIMRIPGALLKRNAEIGDQIEFFPIIAADAPTELLGKLIMKAVLPVFLPRNEKELAATVTTALLGVAGPLAVEGTVISEGATSVGAVGRLVKSAQEYYPRKAWKIELHHVVPKYSGRGS